MRRKSHGLAIALLCAACGDGAGGGGGTGNQDACLDYCQALRTSDSGCGSDVDHCASDCAIWTADSEQAGCPEAFDDVLSCTAGSPDVCESVGHECSEVWSGWAGCIEACDVPGEVVFTPGCTSDAPCSSGAEIEMMSDVPLQCDVRVELTCPGGTAQGTIPAGGTGSITLSCTGEGACGLRVDAANRYLSGGSSVICTP